MERRTASKGAGPGDGTRGAARRADPGWGAHMRGALRLGLPLVGAQLAQMAINVTDTALIGRLGPEPLAAAVLATQGFYLVWIFGSGFAQAVMPLAAGAAGRGDARGIRRSVRMGLWAVLGYGVLVMPPLWHSEAILLGLGQEPAVAGLAGSFMRILQWGMFPALILVVLRSYLGVLDRAGVVLAVTVMGALLNGVLAYALIFGRFGAPALGMHGAAYASLGTNGAMALAALAYTRLAPALKRHELYVRFWRFDAAAFGEVLRLGWPISTTIIAETGLFATASIMMGWFGTVPLAAHGIALQLASIAFMIPLGLANAGTIRVGLAFGAEDWTGIGRSAGATLALSVAFSLAGALVFWTIPEVLIGLYLDRSDPGAAAVLAVGVPLLGVAAAFQIFDGLQAVGTGLLRGLKDTRVPMLMAIGSYWGIGMPVAYLLGIVFDLRGVGVWSGLAAGLFAASTLMTLRFHRRAALGLTVR